MILFPPLINLFFYFQTINFKIIFPVLTLGIVFTLILTLYIKYKCDYAPVYLISNGFNTFLFVVWTRNVTTTHLEFDEWDFILLCTVIVLYSIEFSVFKTQILKMRPSSYLFNSTPITLSVFSLIAFILSINNMLSLWFSLMVLLIGSLFGLLKRYILVNKNQVSPVGYKELIIIYCVVSTIFVLNELFINSPLLVNYNAAAFLAILLDFNFGCVNNRPEIILDNEKQFVLFRRKGKTIPGTGNAEAATGTRRFLPINQEAPNTTNNGASVPQATPIPTVAAVDNLLETPANRASDHPEIIKFNKEAGVNSEFIDHNEYSDDNLPNYSEKYNVYMEPKPLTKEIFFALESVIDTSTNIKRVALLSKNAFNVFLGESLTQISGHFLGELEKSIAINDKEYKVLVVFTSAKMSPSDTSSLPSCLFIKNGLYAKNIYVSEYNIIGKNKEQYLASGILLVEKNSLNYLTPLGVWRDNASRVELDPNLANKVSNALNVLLDKLRYGFVKGSDMNLFLLKSRAPKSASLMKEIEMI